MRRLTQKILSWICTLTLTASLGTAAFADTEDEVLPAEAAPFMEEPAADLPSVPEEDETADDVLAAPSSEFPTDKPETHAPETTPDGEEEEDFDFNAFFDEANPTINDAGFSAGFVPDDEM